MTWIDCIKQTSTIGDVTKTRNWEPGTGNREPGKGNGERESGNECTAVIPKRIQNRQFSHLFLGLQFGI